MNPVDRIIAAFAPQRALARARARFALRAYEGASVGRRSSSWRARHTSANAEIGYSIRPLRDRARELVRNTPHAGRMTDVIVANAIGTGLRPVSKTGSDRIDTQVIDLWHEWQHKADVQGLLTFDAMQALACRAVVESGEVVLRFVDRKPKDIDSPVPLQLQLLESDFIDHFREGIFGGTGGQWKELGVTPETQRSRLGVGLGEFDAFTGLWLWPWHPGEITTYNMRPGISQFVPKEEVLHVFRVLRPGQVRGVTWFAPILQTARDYADFMDAALVKARVEACFAGFITNSDDLEPVLDLQTQDATGLVSSNPDAMLSTLEPGLLKELKSGQDIKFAAPTTTSQIEPLMLTQLMAMAAGVGCTYDQGTGDLRQANYTSLRAGKLEFRRLVEQFQKHTMIAKLCQPVWDRFINRAILAGALRERRGGYPCDWVTPAWESVNPKFDQDAEERSVRAGRMSPQEFIASWGSDWRKQQDDFAEFFKRADSLGLIFDIDPRRLTRGGQMQPMPKEGGDGKPNGANGSANGKDTSSDGTLFDGDGNEIDLSELKDYFDNLSEEGRAFFLELSERGLH